MAENGNNKRGIGQVIGIILSVAVIQAGATIFVTDRFSKVQERQAVTETKQEAYDKKLDALTSGGTDVARQDHTKVAVLEQGFVNQQKTLERIEGLANTNNQLLTAHLNETKNKY